MEQSAGRIELAGISKSFSGVKVLDQVDFSLHQGEIHALLGANGAGKSTLMKILSGTYRLDAGRILLDGREVDISSPQSAMKHGIFTVHQEVDAALVPALTVAENVVLNRFGGLAEGGALVKWSRMYKESKALLERVGLNIPPDKLVGDLSLSEKQLVLLARALSRQARFLILDEPTAPLSQDETDRLFAMVRKLKEEGVGSVFISHRLPEVFELCDRLTVMRDGQRVETLTVSETSQEEVVWLMLGRKVEDGAALREKAAAGEAPVLLDLQGIGRGVRVKEVSLQVKRGEVVGIFGMVGSGKTELSRLIAGADAPERGELHWKGRKQQFGGPWDAIEEGIVLVPEERRAQGILLEESVEVNLTLPSLAKWSPFGWIRGKAVREAARKLIDTFSIVPAEPRRQTGSLSGGNQQKVAIGKWIPRDAELYVLDEPTKGVDVGAKADIYAWVDELAREGKSVIYLSCELEEIFRVADRIIVLTYGAVTADVPREDAMREAVFQYAGAGRTD